MNLPFMLTSLGTISEKRKSLWVHGLSDGDDDDDDDGENGDHRQAALHWTDKHVNASSKKNNGWISTSLSLLCCNLPGFYSQEFILLCPTKAATDNCFTGELLKYPPPPPPPSFCFFYSLNLSLWKTSWKKITMPSNVFFCPQTRDIYQTDVESKKKKKKKKQSENLFLFNCCSLIRSH